LLDDQEVNNYLNSLGYKLVAHSDDASQKFTFFAVNDNTINAFAVPGGYIGLNTGLILRAREESELASVVAHEIAHITQRHIARTIEGGSKWSLPMIAAAVAAIAIGVSSGNADIAQAATMALTAGNIQMQINFTRRHEKEADRIGMQVLAGAGFDPRSMPSFFEQLQTAYRYYDGSNFPEFLRSHPVTTDRIAEARERAADYPEAPPKDELQFHLARAKVLVITHENSARLLDVLQDNLQRQHFENEFALRYAIVLAGLESRQADIVSTHLAWLQKNDIDRVIYRLAAIQLALLKGETDQALGKTQEALKLYPGDRLLAYNAAQLFLAQQQADAALRALQALPDTRNPRYYRLLAEAQKATDQPVEALLSLAEHFYLQGQTHLALKQLEQARQRDLDFYHASRVDARLHELKTLHEEEIRASEDKTE
jgi:predicted Zn-dependent protease